MEDLELQAFAATHWCSEQGSHPKAWKGKTDMVWVLSYRGYGQQKLDTAQLLAQTYGNMVHDFYHKVCEMKGYHLPNENCCCRLCNIECQMYHNNDRKQRSKSLTHTAHI